MSSHIILNRQYQLIILSFGLLILYYLQGLLYPAGSIISQGVLLVYILIGLAYLCRFSIKSKMPVPVKIWILFCFLQIATFLLSPKTVIGNKYEAIGAVSTFVQFKGILTFSLSLFIGLQIGKSRVNYNKILSVIGIILFIIAIYRYFYGAIQFKLAYGKEMTRNNGSYAFILSLPFLIIMFQRFKWISVALFFISVGFVISAAKRGAIVCLAATVLIIGYWYLKNNKLTINKIIVLLTGIISIIGLTIYLYTNNAILQHRIDQTATNGIGMREVAYRVLLDHWINDENIFTKLFGNGMAQSISVWGNYAHNDWLEILISNGLVGVTIYFIFFVSAFYYTIHIKSKSAYELSAIIFLTIWFCTTCFSMGYSSIWGGFSMILLGIIWSRQHYQIN